MKKKTVVLLMALTLLVGSAIGGTMAWLYSQSGSVTNTFVAGNIGSLTLTERDAGDENRNYLFVPGVGIKKNPIVTYTPVDENGSVLNVDAYVFVKVDYANNYWEYSERTYTSANGYLSWGVDSAWTKLENVDNVFYLTAEAKDGTDSVQKWEIMESGSTEMDGVTITVSDDITKAMVDDNTAAVGSLTFTAYAIQKDGMTDEATAWTTVSATSEP